MLPSWLSDAILGALKGCATCFAYTCFVSCKTAWKSNSHGHSALDLKLPSNAATSEEDERTTAARRCFTFVGTFFRTFRDEAIKNVTACFCGCFGSDPTKAPLDGDKLDKTAAGSAPPDALKAAEFEPPQAVVVIIPPTPMEDASGHYLM